MTSQADNLLNTMSEEDIATYAANSSEEEHIVIDTDRNITVPKSLERIAVQFDDHIETVTFDCPRYWDEHDFSQMIVYINYRNAAGDLGRCLADNVRIDETDENIIHFDWLVRSNVTRKDGQIAFIVCIMDDVENHWNSELCTSMYVSEGLDCSVLTGEDYYEANPDILTQLLLLNKSTMERATVYVGSGEMPDWADVQIDPEGSDESIPFSVTNYAWDVIADGSHYVPLDWPENTAVVIPFDTATLAEIRKYKTVYVQISCSKSINDPTSNLTSMIFYDPNTDKRAGTVADFMPDMLTHRLILTFIDSNHYSAIVNIYSGKTLLFANAYGLRAGVWSSEDVTGVGVVDTSAMDESAYLKFNYSKGYGDCDISYTIYGISKEVPATQII